MSAQTFHFSKETPPDSMFSDIQALNKFQDEENLIDKRSVYYIMAEKAAMAEMRNAVRERQFNELCQFVFEFLTDPTKSSRLMSQLEDFAAQNGVGASALKNVFKSLLSIPNSALKKSLTPVQVKEDLVNLGLSESKAEYFCEQWKANLVGLSRSALGQTLMVNQLVDMEWKFGVTAASSELDKVGNTFLQLKLVINTGSGVTNSYMELTLPQFYSFLHEMEKAKASLEILS